MPGSRLNKTEYSQAWLQSYHQELKQNINKHLQEDFLANTNHYHPKLHEAICYSVLGEGQRLRPLVVGLAARSLNYRVPLNVMMAIELIHAYSLIHDDLPSLDDDAIRRNKPSCHVKFGEAIAILTGDLLQARAFYYLTQGEGNHQNRVAAHALLAEAAATMVDGQVHDLFPLRSNPLPQYPHLQHVTNKQSVSWKKTAALFSFACSAPAVLCGYGDKAPQRTRLAEFGGLFGLAYQAFDDLRDEVGQENHVKAMLEEFLLQASSILPSSRDHDGIRALIDWLRNKARSVMLSEAQKE